MANAILRLPVQERSQVAEARRLCTNLARSLGFTETLAGEVSIVASEAAANLYKHAQRGELLVNTIGSSAIDIVSIDHGPGMNLDRCLEDGYSTAGTAGTGLGAIRRLSSAFDAYTGASGTVMFARIEAHRPPPDSVLIGAVRVPHKGESACGDNWAFRSLGRQTAILIADGLGHGQLAAEAANEAVDLFLQLEWRGAGDAVDYLHSSLRGTRGAAIAVAVLDPEQRRIVYSGLGNTSGVIAVGTATQSMVSHNGTAGHSAPRIAEFVYDWPPHATAIFHTDGLTSSWNLSKYPGLTVRHPAVLAGVLFRDYTRGRDDVTVVAFRESDS